MRLGSFVSIVLVSLAAGCAGSQARAVNMSDPMWIPPGVGDLEVADSAQNEPAPRPTPRARALKQPNRAKIASYGLRMPRDTR